MTGTASSGVTFVPLDGALAAFADAGASRSPDRQTVGAVAAHALGPRLGQLPAVLLPRQRHTRIVFAFRGALPVRGVASEVGICDALITDEPGAALLVVTADCLPIALAGGGCVAMVHAGWRGLAADILGAVTSQLAAEYGVAAELLEAVIGVGVGPCHYQVGREVVDGLAPHEVGETSWHDDGWVDLGRWARGRLLALGVRDERITTLAGCTACSPRHHSYRRDGEGAGRQWSAVALSPSRQR